MVFLYFATIDSKGVIEEYFLGNTDIENAFEVLTNMVNNGFKLTEVYLSNSWNSYTSLPIEAFDGVSMKKYIESLQKEWELVLNES